MAIETLREPLRRGLDLCSSVQVLRADDEVCTPELSCDTLREIDPQFVQLREE